MGGATNGLSLSQLSYCVDRLRLPYGWSASFRKAERTLVSFQIQSSGIQTEVHAVFPGLSPSRFQEALLELVSAHAAREFLAVNRAALESRFIDPHLSASPERPDAEIKAY